MIACSSTSASTAYPAPIANSACWLDRDRRVACALRLRRDVIHQEMESCLRQREQAYTLADALLDEFDELAAVDKRLGSDLMQVELRLQRCAAYFISDEQATTILDEIAAVGADTRRFCEYLGVEAVAKIPAHRFREALAALEAKRDRRAA